MAKKKSSFLRGARILPPRVRGDETAAALVESAFTSYNAGRLREAARLLTTRMLADDVTVAMSLTGALTASSRAQPAISVLYHS